MPTPMSELHMALVELLADGQWHPYRDINEQLGQRIAPGKALRQYQNRDERRRDGPRKLRPLSEDQQIATGRRLLAGAQIHRARDRFVEVADFPDGRRIRRHPDCPVNLPGGPAHRQDQALTDTASVGAGAPSGGPSPAAPPWDAPASAAQQCPECGVAVVQAELHAGWHERQPVTRTEMGALLHQMQEGIRSAVAGELAMFLAGRRAP